MKNVKLPKIRIVVVLWGRLCDKGVKVTYWNDLEKACEYIETIESGLSRRVFNGEIHWGVGYEELASARVEIVDTDFDNG